MTRGRVAPKVISRIKSLSERSEELFWKTGPGKRARKQIANKNAEIASLKAQLAVARGEDAARSSSTYPFFFIVGNQKSGTTWLMKTLDAHPEVMCRGEGRPFGRQFRKKGRSGYPPASLSNAIHHAKFLRLWIQQSVWTKRDNLNRHLDNLTRLAVEYFLSQELARTDKKFVGDKTVLLGPQNVREIREILPDAKVIHIIRDGRDVAVSTAHHVWNQAEDMGGGSTISDAQRERRDAYRRDPKALIETGGGIFSEGWIPRYATRWKSLMEPNIEDGRNLLGDDYTEVRYEDLLSDPYKEATRLFAFLGADASPEIVAKCVDAASFERLSEGRKPGEEAASFFRKGIAGDWKNVFTEENKRDYKEAAGEFLISLGYEKDLDW